VPLRERVVRRPLGRVILSPRSSRLSATDTTRQARRSRGEAGCKAARTGRSRPTAHCAGAAVHHRDDCLGGLRAPAVESSTRVLIADIFTRSERRGTRPLAPDPRKTDISPGGTHPLASDSPGPGTLPVVGVSPYPDGSRTRKSTTVFQGRPSGNSHSHGSPDRPSDVKWVLGRPHSVLTLDDRTSVTNASHTTAGAIHDQNLLLY